MAKRKHRRRAGGSGAPEPIELDDRVDTALEDHPPIPDAWVAEVPRFGASSHPAFPSESLSALLADHPRRSEPVVLAEAMELASWEEAAAEQVQCVICQDPECGIEGCEPGSWVTLRAVDGMIEIGVSGERDAFDAFAFREYRPPRWLTELGPCRIPEATWDALAAQAQATRPRREGRLPAVRLPTAAQVAAGKPA